MWTPTAMRKMVMMPKKMIVWTRMDNPLVCMFPNSTTLPLPGSWNNSPGLSSTKSTTAITTGPQSAMLINFHVRNSLFNLLSLWIWWSLASTLSCTWIQEYIVIQTSFLLGWYGKEERNKTERISEEEDILGWVPSHRCQSHAYASTCDSSSFKRSLHFPSDDKDLSNFYYNADSLGLSWDLFFLDTAQLFFF